MWTPTTRAQHSRAGLRYGSGLTDAEWTILAPFLPPEARCGRKRAYPMREVANAICYVLRGGIAWRLMPDTFPPWRTVYRWFARLRDGGTWETINHHLVMQQRHHRHPPRRQIRWTGLSKSSTRCCVGWISPGISPQGLSRRALSVSAPPSPAPTVGGPPAASSGGLQAWWVGGGPDSSA